MIYRKFGRTGLEVSVIGIGCEILSALDGKNEGAYAGTKAVGAEEYARIREEYHADAWLYGTVTTKEFTQGRKLVLHPESHVPDWDFVAENNAAFIIFLLIPRGRLAGNPGHFRKPAGYGWNYWVKISI